MCYPLVSPGKSLDDMLLFLMPNQVCSICLCLKIDNELARTCGDENIDGCGAMFYVFIRMFEKFFLDATVFRESFREE